MYPLLQLCSPVKKVINFHTMLIPFYIGMMVHVAEIDNFYSSTDQPVCGSVCLILQHSFQIQKLTNLQHYHYKYVNYYSLMKTSFRIFFYSRKKWTTHFRLIAFRPEEKSMVCKWEAIKRKLTSWIQKILDVFSRKWNFKTADTLVVFFFFKQLLLQFF